VPALGGEPAANHALPLRNHFATRPGNPPVRAALGAGPGPSPLLHRPVPQEQGLPSTRERSRHMGPGRGGLRRDRQGDRAQPEDSYPGPAPRAQGAQDPPTPDVCPRQGHLPPGPIGRSRKISQHLPGPDGRPAAGDCLGRSRQCRTGPANTTASGAVTRELPLPRCHFVTGGGVADRFQVRPERIPGL
jgi:hypothetical protein